MGKLSYTARRLVAIWLLMLMQILPVMAGDEDMSPSVYQIFDPETGYMIPVDPETARQIDHGLSVDPAAQGTTSADGTARSVGQTAGQFKVNSWWLGGIIALALIGGIVFLAKKRATVQTSVST